MAINLKRRDAFSKMFRQYHAVLDAFIRQNVRSNKPIIDPVKVKTVLLMQFVVRLVKARAKGGTEAINWFAFELTGRYVETRNLLMGDTIISADDKYRAALTSYEQELANTIFDALVTETNIVCCKFSPENTSRDTDHAMTMCGKPWGDKCPHEEFVEVDFWRDIFIALNDPLTLQPLILDYMREFKDALDAAPAEEVGQ